LIGTPDLSRSVDEFKAHLGVEPVFGGSHPAHGTSNYLVRIGERSYAEFIGPNVGGQIDELGRFVRDLPGERLIGAAFETSDLDATARRARELGVVLESVRTDSRDTPEGERLSWRMALFERSVFPGLIMFAIEWAGSSHPSLSGAGAELSELEIITPKAAASTYVHDLMNSDVRVVADGELTALRCRITSAVGSVTYTSRCNPVFAPTG
jgi:hypothetical protein